MKKSLLLATLASVILVSCVSDDAVEVNEKQKNVKIEFSTPVMYNNAESRANVKGELGTYTYTGTTATYTYPRNEEFKIFAVQHEGDLTGWGDAVGCEFNGQPLKYDPNVDAWAPKKDDEGYYYWPLNKKLSFAAMSPADLEQTPSLSPEYGATGLVLNNFKIPSEPAEQFDLLFSKRVVNKTAADMLHGADYYSGIPIEFQHALSSIHFSLLKDNTVTEQVVLTNICLKNVYDTGSFNENITEGADAGEYERGENGNVSPKWTVNNASGASMSDYIAFTGKAVFPIEAQYVSAIAASDKDETGEDEQSHALLLMPQTLTEDVILHVEFTVGDETIPRDIKLVEYPKATGVSPITAWEIGKRYTYRLYYSKESEKQDIIYFAPSTGNWVEMPVIEIRL